MKGARSWSLATTERLRNVSKMVSSEHFICLIEENYLKENQMNLRFVAIFSNVLFLAYSLCTDLQMLIDERAEIEEMYGKKLRAWSKKWKELIVKGISLSSSHHRQMQ